MGGAPLQPGRVLKGKYRVDRPLGKGGMGWVVAGEHLGLNQRVAIKVLHEHMRDQPEIVARFAREARAASAIQSDHVARVMDVDALEDGTPFMVMELLEGEDLGFVRRDREPLPVPVAVGYVLEACEAIAEAHALGIVHRDIKPSNLFLASRPNGKVRVKVLDFGISKVPVGQDASVTATEAVVGSAHYMSPEQMRASRDVDARTDIWSLGVTLYELTTAALPFPGTLITHVCALVMSESPAPPSTIRPDLPPGFDEVVLRCLSRDRDARFSSIAELAAALAPFAPPEVSAGSFSASRPLRGAPPSIGVPAGTTGTALSTTHVPTRTSPNAPLVIGVAAALGLACVGAGYVALRSLSPASAQSGAVPSIAASSAPAPAVVAVSPAPVSSFAPGAAETAPGALAPTDVGSATPPPSVSVAGPAPTPSAAAPRPRGRLAKPVVDCDPPFVLNPDGTKRAKPECL